MKILAIYRHYWPDTTPYARLLRTILEHLVAEGHPATVFTAQPSYNDVPQSKQAGRETLGGVRIRRIRLLPERKRFKLLRAVNFVCFLLRAVLHTVFHRKYDLIVANTYPPVLTGATLRLIKWLTGIPYLLHCQDIHPESAVLAAQLGEGWFSRRLLVADIKSCRAARTVVTLSRDMREQLASRAGYAAENVRVINNFPLDRYGEPASIPSIFQDRADGSFRVLFAGNMGLFQNLERLIAAARLLRDEPRIRFILMGEGATRNRLVKQAGALAGRSVFFESFQRVETAFACMQRSDLGVIALAEGVYRVAYPSKTMTYLAAGLPVLAVVESNSNLADEVTSHQFGYVPQSTTAADIAASIRTAFAERETWSLQARKALIQRAEQVFGRDRAMRAWSELVRQLDEEPSAARSAPQPQKRAA